MSECLTLLLGSDLISVHGASPKLLVLKSKLFVMLMITEADPSLDDLAVEIIKVDP